MGTCIKILYKLNKHFLIILHECSLNLEACLGSKETKKLKESQRKLKKWVMKAEEMKDIDLKRLKAVSTCQGNILDLFPNLKEILKKSRFVSEMATRTELSNLLDSLLKGSIQKTMNILLLSYTMECQRKPRNEDAIIRIFSWMDLLPEIAVKKCEFNDLLTIQKMGLAYTKGIDINSMANSEKPLVEFCNQIFNLKIQDDIKFKCFTDVFLMGDDEAKSTSRIKMEMLLSEINRFTNESAKPSAPPPPYPKDSDNKEYSSFIYPEI